MGFKTIHPNLSSILYNTDILLWDFPKAEHEKRTECRWFILEVIQEIGAKKQEDEAGKEKKHAT